MAPPGYRPLGEVGTGLRERLFPHHRRRGLAYEVDGGLAADVIPRFWSHWGDALVRGIGILGLVAPGLYERLGYETVGVIEGCPDGSAARRNRRDL